MQVKIDELRIGGREFNVVANVIGDSWIDGDPDTGLLAGWETCEVDSISSCIEWHRDTETYTVVTDELLLKMIEKAIEETVDENPDLLAQIESE